MKYLDVVLSNPPTIYCDDQSVIALSDNLVFDSIIKHLGTNFHFVRERVQWLDLQILYIPTNDQTANILTEGFHGPTFVKALLQSQAWKPQLKLKRDVDYC